jgi:hypothetical protein
MKSAAHMAAFALALGTFTAGNAIFAQAAITNRAECYTAVTTACNKKKSDEAIGACNDSGHSQCDKQFPNVGGMPDPQINFRAGTTMKQAN